MPERGSPEIPGAGGGRGGGGCSGLDEGQRRDEPAKPGNCPPRSSEDPLRGRERRSQGEKRSRRRTGARVLLASLRLASPPPGLARRCKEGGSGSLAGEAKAGASEEEEAAAASQLRRWPAGKDAETRAERRRARRKRHRGGGGAQEEPPARLLAAGAASPPPHLFQVGAPPRGRGAGERGGRRL